jgi:hypothetical protein
LKNIQQPTFNIEHPMAEAWAVVGYRELVVGGGMVMGTSVRPGAAL